ncbi:MAG: hypothetical protein KIT14_24995 [bacterium]|nr:hypothetical protein [bacterium]
MDAPRSWRVRAELLRLALRSRVSRRAAVDPACPTVVTMTTHRARLASVHLALESIARGTVRPGRLLLWIDDPALLAALPGSWRRLERRGVEILPAAREGVHTKWFPYVHGADRHTRPLVTADDDMIYPPGWLAGLVAAHRRHPGDVLCYRAHRMRFDGEALAPYPTWGPCRDGVATIANFGTSVSGQLFPPHLLDAIAGAGTGFRDRCPHADDVWLHHCALRAGARVRQIVPEPIHFEFIPRTQDVALHRTNFSRDNDLQIAATYDAADLARVRAAVPEADAARAGAVA